MPKTLLAQGSLTAPAKPVGSGGTVTITGGSNVGTTGQGGNITLTSGSTSGVAGSSGAFTITAQEPSAWFCTTNESLTLTFGDQTVTVDDVTKWKAQAEQVDQLAEKVEKLETLVKTLLQRIEDQEDMIGGLKAGVLLDTL